MLEARLIGGIGDWFSQRVVKIRRNLSPEDWTHVSLLFSSFFFVVGEPIEESRLDRARRTTEGRKNELTFLLGNGTASSFYFFLFYFFVHRSCWFSRLFQQAWSSNWRAQNFPWIEKYRPQTVWCWSNLLSGMFLFLQYPLNFFSRITSWCECIEGVWNSWNSFQLQC